MWLVVGQTKQWPNRMEDHTSALAWFSVRQTRDWWFSVRQTRDWLDQRDDHTNYLLYLFLVCMDYPQEVSKTIGEFSIVFIYASPLPALVEYQPSHQNCENTQLISTTDAQHKIWLRGTESKWCHRSWYKLLVDHLPFVAAHLLRLDMEDGIWVLISHAKLRSGLNKRYNSDIYYKYIQTTIEILLNHM